MGEREDVADVVVDDEDAAPGQHPAGAPLCHSLSRVVSGQVSSRPLGPSAGPEGAAAGQAVRAAETPLGA